VQVVQKSASMPKALANSIVSLIVEVISTPIESVVSCASLVMFKVNVRSLTFAHAVLGGSQRSHRSEEENGHHYDSDTRENVQVFACPEVW
jgi:hypothetical protein